MWDGQFLLALLLLFGSGGWCYPGIIESMSGSKTFSSPPRSTYQVVETVYDTVWYEISSTPSSKSRSTSRSYTSSTARQSCTHGSSIIVLQERGSPASTITMGPCAPSTTKSVTSSTTKQSSGRRSSTTVAVRRGSTSSSRSTSPSASSTTPTLTRSSTSQSSNYRSSTTVLPGGGSAASMASILPSTSSYVSSTSTNNTTLAVEQSSTQSSGAQSVSASLISKSSASSNSSVSTSTSTQSMRTSITSQTISSSSIPTMQTSRVSSNSSTSSSLSSSISMSTSTLSQSSSQSISAREQAFTLNVTITSSAASGRWLFIPNPSSAVTTITTSTISTSLTPVLATTSTSASSSRIMLLLNPSITTPNASNLSTTSTASSSFNSVAAAKSASLASMAAAASASSASVAAVESASSASVAAVASASLLAAQETATPANCNDGTWDLTVDNYKKANTDANLNTWWNGGTDNETGITFPPKKAPGTFLTQALAASFEPVGEQFACTLEQHSCQPADGCANYAVHIPSGVSQVGPAKYFNQIGPASHYGWFAVHSIANIYSFAETFISGLTSAGIQLASENLQLTETFSQPVNQKVLLRGLLIGFSFLVAIFFSFIPVIGEVIGMTIAGATMVAAAVTGAAVIASTGLGTAAGFIGISLVNGASLDLKAASFGAYMGMIFNNTAGAVDQLVNQLMNGVAINAAPGVTNPTLFDFISNGRWLNTTINTNPSLSITAMTEVMRSDLMSRGINYIWTQSKIWVTFVNLNDDANMTLCQADLNGWQASKTCADGGVYYLYRFNEDGHLRGHLDYPWGADKMTMEPFGLSPNWVTRSSAASYRAQNNGVGGFNYDQTVPTNLTTALTQVVTTGTLDSLRYLPGVWNLSVCDMGEHADWNVDFTANPPTTLYRTKTKFLFPCCCGPGCSQTADFIRASNQENFDTIVKGCKLQLALCSAWPEGVSSIDYGQAGKITNGSCAKGDTAPSDRNTQYGDYDN